MNRVFIKYEVWGLVTYVGGAAIRVFSQYDNLPVRYIGDVKDPEGGVRGVIPDKRIYKSK